MISALYSSRLSVVCLAQLSLCFSVFGQSVFETDFEVPDYTLGTLVSDPVWNFDSSLLDVQIDDLDVYSGFQSIHMTGRGEFSYFVDPAQPLPSIVWVDMSLKPVFMEERYLPLSFDADRSVVTSFVKLDADGEVFVVDGDFKGSGQWFATGFQTPLIGERSANWLRMTYRLDYSKQSWDLYINGQMIAFDLGFLNPSAARLETFSLKGADDLQSGFDAFSIQEDSPLYVDADNDGIDDAYEAAQGLNTLTNDRYSDKDFDSISNVQEYVSGLSAGDADSDGDGVHDGAELAANADPKTADVYDLGTLPYSEDFEGLAEGPINGQSLWTVSGDASIQGLVARGGAQALRLDSHLDSVHVHRPFDGRGSSAMWVDYYIQPLRISDESSADYDPLVSGPVYRFLDEDRVLVGDVQKEFGLIDWYRYAHAASSDDWVRVTRYEDYATQRFALWINGVQIPGSYGFAQPQPYFNRFELEQSLVGTSYLDDVWISAQKPQGLDSDDDGLFDEVEDANGNGIVDDGETDPFLADTDGDGRIDSAAANLQLWLTADKGVVADGSGNVSQWTDRSVFKQHALASSDAAEAPVLVDDFVNGEPAVRFDGVDDFLSGVSSFNINNSDYTLVVVQRCVSEQDRGGVISFARWLTGGTQHGWGHSDASIRVDHGVVNHMGIGVDLEDRSDELLLVSARRSGGSPAGNGGTIDLRVLANEAVWTASGTQTWQSDDTTDYLVGKTKEGNPNHFGGEILEIRVYDAALTNEETQLLEAELALKYGLNLDANGNEISDGWESNHFGRLLALGEDLQDHDGDGLNAFREFNLGLDPNVADGSGFPLNDPDLKVWLSADRGLVVDENGDVQSWADLSGNALTALPESGTGMPSFEQSGFNGNPTVFFDGDETLGAVTPKFDLSTGDYTIIAVHSAVDVSTSVQSIISFRNLVPENGAPILGWRNATNIGEVVNGGTPLTATVSDVDGGIGFATALRRDGDRLRVNHEGYTGTYFESGDRNPGTKGSSGFFLGQEKPKGSKKLEGRISEILVFDRPLTDQELSELMAALRAQYGIVDDIDGDGLSNLEEDTNANGVVDAGENDPRNTDSDGDGLLDPFDSIWVADPVLDAAFLQSQPDGSARLRLSFDSADGYAIGELGGQQGWEAAPIFKVKADGAVDQGLSAEGVVSDLNPFTLASNFAQARHYVDTDETLLWVSFDAKLAPTRLQEVDLSSNPAVALALVDEATVAVYDSSIDDWTLAPLPTGSSDWVAYDLQLDYVNKVWHLCVGGQLVIADIPFVDPTRTSLEQFRILQQGGDGLDAWIDEIEISDTEPVGLDFDNDGLDNALERSLGSDLFSEDTDTDGIPDAWEYNNGLDLLDVFDAASNNDGDLLTNIEEFELGLNPNDADEDADGVMDGYGMPGLVEMRVWNEVDGSKIATLTSLDSYPDFPDYRKWLDRLEHRGGLADDYGSLTRGYIIPHETADYVFHLTGDDNAQFWLSDDEHMYNKVLRASVPYFTGWDEWDKYESQVSEAIHLIAGKRYYFEILQKEAFYNDHFQVAWSRVGKEREIISGAYLQSLLPDPLAEDLDGDGLAGYLEIQYGTDPLLSDTDGDGISDYDEIFHLFSDPLSVDVSPENVVAVATAVGSGASSVVGQWMQRGDGIVAQDLRGKLTYDLNVSTAGFYRLRVNINNRNPGSSLKEFLLALTMGGELIQHASVFASYTESGDIFFYLPYLAQGINSFELDWLNGESSKVLQVNEVVLEALDGPDQDQNGLSDWVDHRLGVISGLDQNFAQSKTSPYCLEGSSSYLEGLVITSDFDPDGVLAAIEIDPLHALKGQYYANVDLADDGVTTINVSGQGGNVNFAKQVEWLVSDILVEDDLLIRTGDSLKLGANVPSGSHTDPLIFQVVDAVSASEVDRFTVPLGAHLIYEFSNAGQFVVRALDNTEQELGSMDVTVRGADLGGDTSAIVGNSREWWPTLLPEELIVQSDAHLALLEITPQGAAGRRFEMRISGQETARVITRAGGIDGPIVDSAKVLPLTNYFYASFSVGVLELFEDGSRLIRATINVGGDLPDDFRVVINVFRGGVTLEDGSLRRVITAADIGEDGVYDYNLLMAPGVDGGACHSLNYFDEGVILSGY